jgi:hypothetical protein
VTGNPTVVIVDQNAENRAELPRMLQLAGIIVIGDASYGIEATTGCC